MGTALATAYRLQGLKHRDKTNFLGTTKLVP